MISRQFTLGQMFGVLFWIAGALAIWRLSFAPGLGDTGSRLAICVLGAWIGGAVGSHATNPARWACLGIVVAALYALVA